MFNICRQAYSTISRSRYFSAYNPRNCCTSCILFKRDIRISAHRPCASYPFARRYSKKHDEDPCKPKSPCSPKPIDECMPKDECQKKNLPYLDECARPNLMSDCPKPDCIDEPEKSSNRNLILGVAALVGALAGLWYFLSNRPKDPCTPGRKLMLKGGQDAKETVCGGRPAPVKDPKCSDDIPNHVQYLLIGGGTASFAAFRAIKSSDPRAKVLVVTSEDQYPYMRPPLSKEMWYVEDSAAASPTLDFKQWNGTVRSLFYEPNEFYLNIKDLNIGDKGGVAVARGWTVSHLDVVNRKAILEDGYEIGFDKVLIATGSIPKTLDVIDKADDCVKERAFTYRTASDFQYMHDLLKDANSVVIIGGGFLGSELACSLSRKKRFKVTQVFKEKGHMGSVLPEYLSLWTTERIRNDGVEVHTSAEVVGAVGSDKEVNLKLSSGKSLQADVVILAVGVTPDTSMSDKSCLEVDGELGGYLVNTELQARSNVYVAGDAACFFDPTFGRRRIEHHDNAVISGRLAGENMTGAGKPYCHQSMFWSDLGPDIGYEGIGLVHASLPTVGVFAKAAPPAVDVPPVPEAVKEVPEQCMPYLTPEQEEAQRKLKEEFDEKMRQVEEAKQKIKEEAEKAGTPKVSPEYNKGVIFYLKNDIIVGIVLWNVFNRMSIARQVLQNQCKYEDLNEVAKLFNIHEE